MELEMIDFATITHHGGAIICSYNTVLNHPLDTAQMQITNLIVAIQQFIETQGGFVGHIKAYLEEEGRGCALSATGGAVSVTPGCSEQTAVHFTAIVFSVDEKKLQILVEQLFEEIPKA